MWLLIKTAWRNLFRQSRRTLITVTAMSVSLVIAIPTYGLMEGIRKEMLRGITGMELGHLQLHDPAYPRGRAMQSTLGDAHGLLQTVRKTQGVIAAAPRVHGFALAAHDRKVTVRLVAVADNQSSAIRFGRPINDKAPWREDRALSCEVLASRLATQSHGISVGAVLTPEFSRRQGRCERLRVVGLLKRGPSTTKGSLVLMMHAADLRLSFAQLEGVALVRHAAALALYGVDPTHERKVSFMPRKAMKGRYLSPEARGELVVGYRLAKTLKLGLGDKLFVQAGALDQTQGSFYRNFKIVGIYRTGIDIIDRSRVFLHIEDAQAVMTLGKRIHEIAVIGEDAANPEPLVERLRAGIRPRLQIATTPRGKRAGAAPLSAPITVHQLDKKGNAQLLIPYDLKRRFEELEGLAAVARRVYGRATLRKPAVQVLAGKPHSYFPEKGGVPTAFVGLEPAAEQRLSQLASAVKRGSSLPLQPTDGDWPLLLSERHAKALDVALGAKLFFDGKDEDGNPVQYRATLIGVLDDGKWSPALPQAVLPYYSAQQIDSPRLNARAHELLLLPKPKVDVAKLAEQARARLAPSVRSWRTISPDMAKLIETQDVWMGIFMLIIFGIAAMTVMNTMLMAVFERTREFGVLKSLGMRPRQVFAMIVLETLALAFCAALVGGGLGILLNHWAVVDGIDLSKWSGGFTYQGTFIDPVWRAIHSVKVLFLPIVMVMLVCLLVSFYPAWRAGRLKPVQALRHHN